MLTSLQNPLVKQMRKLSRGKERRQQNLLLLEGTNLIAAACEQNYSLATLVHTRTWQENHPQLWQVAQQRSQRVEMVTPELLRAIATTVSPDGVVATVSRSHPRPQISPDFKLGLMMHRLQDPGNLGTIIRTAVAAGAEGLWLSSDSVDVEHPKVLRASVGEWFKMPMVTSDNLEATLREIPCQDKQIIATLPEAEKEYWQIDFSVPSLILLGNEAAGLTENLIALANEKVSVPLHNGAESLNVAIAAALLLYEAQRQRTNK